MGIDRPSFLDEYKASKLLIEIVSGAMEALDVPREVQIEHDKPATVT